VQRDLLKSDVDVLVRAVLEGRAVEEQVVGEHRQKGEVVACCREVVAYYREPVKQARRDEERQKLRYMLETLGLYDHTTLVPHWKG
jgi:hypothetical protein